jgi:hypothetical protein
MRKDVDTRRLFLIVSHTAADRAFPTSPGDAAVGGPRSRRIDAMRAAGGETLDPSRTIDQAINGG